MGLFGNSGSSTSVYEGGRGIRDAEQHPSLFGWNQRLTDSLAEQRREEYEAVEFYKFQQGRVESAELNCGHLEIRYCIKEVKCSVRGYSWDGGQIDAEILVRKGAMTRAEADAIRAECEAKQFQSPPCSQTCPSSEPLPTPRAAAESSFSKLLSNALSAASDIFTPTRAEIESRLVLEKQEKAKARDRAAGEREGHMQAKHKEQASDEKRGAIGDNAGYRVVMEVGALVVETDNERPCPCCGRGGHEGEQRQPWKIHIFPCTGESQFDNPQSGSEPARDKRDVEAQAVR